MASFRPPRKSSDNSTNVASAKSSAAAKGQKPRGRSEERAALRAAFRDVRQKSFAESGQTRREKPKFPPLDHTRKNTAKVGRAWHLNLVPDALDRLREHPDFDLDGDRAAADETGHIIAAHNIQEDDREALYHLELLRIFRQRMQFVATLTLFLLPFFASIYVKLLPATQSEVLMTTFCCFGVSLAMRMLSHRVAALWQARFWTLLSFGLYAVAAGVVVALMDQNQFDNQYAIYYTHNYLMLSVLLLPFTLVETFIVGVILLASLAWSGWWAAPPGMGYFYLSHLFVLGVTIFLVLCIAHFQGMLRRNAFDAAFDLARSAARLSALSTTDVVTGGYNRLQLEQTLSFEIARAARFERPLSLIMFDLDNFKKVNDTHGHTAGDEVLREVWQGAMETIREIDTVARYGGDEFLIVLPETPSGAAHAIANRLQIEVQGRLRRLFGTATPEGRVTLSIGVLTYHGSEPVSIEELVSRADGRLYEAKRSGKNRVV